MKDSKRIEAAQKAANHAFWNEIKKHFPEVRDHNLPFSLIMYWEKEQIMIIRNWLIVNGGAKPSF